MTPRRAGGYTFEREADAIGEGANRGLNQSDSTAEIRMFIRAVRRHALATSILTTAWDIAWLAIAVGLLGSALSAWTLRGDLWAWIGAGVFLCVVPTLIVVRALHAHRQWGRDRAVARAIASRSDRVPAPLRHEILGVLELLELPAAHHSQGLTRAYVEYVAASLRRAACPPSRVLPRPPLRRRAATTLALAIGLVVGATSDRIVSGAILWLHATDARTPEVPRPVWSSLDLELRDPPHTGRLPRTVSNPSGPLRVLAGTEIVVDLRSRHEADSAEIVLVYDRSELGAQIPPEISRLLPQGDLRWTGSFRVRGSGTWSVVLHDRDHQSPAMSLELEVDRPPDVELLPLPRGGREVDEQNAVELRFHATDDFGLAQAELVYQLPEGEAQRLPLEVPQGTRGTWRHRYTWDISRVPIKQRSEVLYWIEVRDNDPGLGLQPLPDPPGKMTRSATMRLTIRDDESEHAANLVSLAEIRDRAIDLLAERLTTSAFLRTEDADVHDQLEGALRILATATELLAKLAAVIDGLALDGMVRPRDAESLAAIHGRLMSLHREELALHELLPSPQPRLDRLHDHNRKEVAALEDEIIRIDDLLDGQVMASIEALVARLETTQRKLLDELEQLKAGDESARARIDQLEQRRREDMRRLAEARAMLRKEVEHDFVNLDAFEILEQMAAEADLEAMLEQGEVEHAIDRARDELGELQNLRDQVQRSLSQSDEGPPEALSEEEQQRMQLLRELSRLQDEEAGLRGLTRDLHETWRDVAAQDIAAPAAREKAENGAKAIRSDLERINDARLGREGRRGLEDAIAALRELESAAQRQEVGQLELAELSSRVTTALQDAVTGSEAQESEGRSVRSAESRAQRLETQLRAPLPAPEQVLPPAELERLADLALRQRGAQQRQEAIDQGELAPLLPPEGRKALRQAGRAMERSARELGAQSPRTALHDQADAWQSIQRAIDSLRQGAPPPPPPSGGGEASTEAERDRSLRDALLEAMRDGTPKGFDEPVKRYYEELLR